MKVLFIDNARIPTEKAHGYQIAKVCEEIAALGAETELWLPARRNPISEDLFEFYGIKKNFTVRQFGSFDAFILEKYLGRATFFLQSTLFLFLLAFAKVPKDAIIYTRNPEIAFVFGIYGKMVFYNAHNFPTTKLKLFRFFLHRVSGIVCNSHGTETAFQKAGFKNSTAIPNGVDLGQFENLPSKSAARERFGLPKEKKIILYVGHFYAWKGIDVIFEVAEKMKRDKKNGNRANNGILFVLVGGTAKDFEKYDVLRKERNLENILLFSYKKKTEIPVLISCADVLLLPNVSVTKESEQHTSPIKMFEYMASGVPIVASRLPSIEEILNDKNAVLVKAGDVDALTDGIEKILQDKILTHSLAIKAKQDVHQYTWTKHAEKLLRCLGSSDTIL